MSELQSEIFRRRTFGIISHPDAGKTTLTEKLLLFGGAITTAGAVKSKKASRYATSDFMEIEKQRGISVATSVMGFEYRGYKVNLLDTPGHEDFCEDTYRTLTAVDSAVMVIDSSKGVEAQTYKLLEVCKMRNTPIMTFMNKLDREGYDPIVLLDEIEEKLGMLVCPMSWPIGMGKSFKGVYSIYDRSLILFKSHGKQTGAGVIAITDIASEDLDRAIGEDEAKQLRADVEMVLGVYPQFNSQDYLDGLVTPVFFGSALNNFGVREMLDFFIQTAPAPRPRETNTRVVMPTEEKFSGFIFKIHANMDPKHRDRIAFLRICSGTFVRGEKLFNVRTDKIIRASNPTAFMASSKEIIDFAYPGDIVGIHDTGNVKIGDTLTLGEKMMFKGIPNFSPEIFKRVVNLDPLKTKQLLKGLEQLCEEGVAQLFTRHANGDKVVGTVGALQFEVIQFRLQHEYGASCRFDPLPFVKACWIRGDQKEIDAFVQLRYREIAQDGALNWVYLSETQWSLEREIKEHPEISFCFTSEG
jgi:peptide chain release factor 3